MSAKKVNGKLVKNSPMGKAVYQPHVLRQPRRTACRGITTLEFSDSIDLDSIMSAIYQTYPSFNLASPDVDVEINKIEVVSLQPSMFTTAFGVKYTTRHAYDSYVLPYINGMFPIRSKSLQRLVVHFTFSDVRQTFKVYVARVDHHLENKALSISLYDGTISVPTVHRIKKRKDKSERKAKAKILKKENKVKTQKATINNHSKVDNSNKQASQADSVTHSTPFSKACSEARKSRRQGIEPPSDQYRSGEAILEQVNATLTKAHEYLAAHGVKGSTIYYPPRAAVIASINELTEMIGKPMNAFDSWSVDDGLSRQRKALALIDSIDREFPSPPK